MKPKRIGYHTFQLQNATVVWRAKGLLEITFETGNLIHLGELRALLEMIRDEEKKP